MSTTSARGGCSGSLSLLRASEGVRAGWSEEEGGTGLGSAKGWEGVGAKRNAEG